MKIIGKTGLQSCNDNAYNNTNNDDDDINSWELCVNYYVDNCFSFMQRRIIRNTIPTHT